MLYKRFINFLHLFLCSILIFFIFLFFSIYSPNVALTYPGILTWTKLYLYTKYYTTWARFHTILSISVINRFWEDFPLFNSNHNNCPTLSGQLVLKIRFWNIFFLFLFLCWNLIPHPIPLDHDLNKYRLVFEKILRKTILRERREELNMQRQRRGDFKTKFLRHKG